MREICKYGSPGGGLGNGAAYPTGWNRDGVPGAGYSGGGSWGKTCIGVANYRKSHSQGRNLRLRPRGTRTLHAAH